MSTHQREATCLQCCVRYKWRGLPELKHAVCPECAEFLEKTLTGWSRARVAQLCPMQYKRPGWYGIRNVDWHCGVCLPHKSVLSVGRNPKRVRCVKCSRPLYTGCAWGVVGEIKDCLEVGV